MDKKMNIVEKIKEHKKTFIAAGVIISLAGVILITKKWNSLKVFSNSGLPNEGSDVFDNIAPATDFMDNNLTQNLSCDKFIDVNEHIRNLSLGKQASAEKLSTAAANGYNLLPNQTWVNRYKKKYS